jgi:transposase
MATAGACRPTRKGCPNHPIEFKRRLAATACQPEISVAKLALEHGVNANLLFNWRRQYRAGKFGAPDPAHKPASSCADLSVATSRSDTAVTLLPVQTQATEADVVAASACIEVVFRSATVRICGAPEMAALRIVLDTLARRS